MVCQVEIRGAFANLIENGCVFDPRYAIGTKTLRRIRYEVPGAAFRYQAERVDNPAAGFAASRSVANFEFAIASDRFLHGRQYREVFSGTAPSGGVHKKPLAHRNSLLAQRSWQSRHELVESTFRGAGQTRVANDARLRHKQCA